MPESIIEYCFRLLSWHKWMKLLEINWNCNILLMIFLISLPIVLSKIIGQKVLGESYDFLLGLEIIMDVETLRYDGQWPN